jgi:hypothetical protein
MRVNTKRIQIGDPYTGLTGKQWLGLLVWQISFHAFLFSPGIHQGSIWPIVLQVTNLLATGLLCWEDSPRQIPEGSLDGPNVSDEKTQFCSALEALPIQQMTATIG